MKRSSIILFAALVAMTFVTNSAKASSPDQRFRFGLNVNVSLPLGPIGDFSTYDNFAFFSEKNNQGKVAKEGGLVMGFGLDLKATYRLNDNGLRAYAKLGFLVNQLCIEASDSIVGTVRRNMGGLVASSKIENPMMVTVPLLVGAHYDLNIVNNFGLFAEAGVGVVFRSMSTSRVRFYDFTVPVYTEDMRAVYAVEYSNKAKVATSFAFEAGVGVNFSKWLSAGVFYSFLGSSDVKYTEISKYEFESGSPETVTRDFAGGHLTNQQLTLRLGFTF